MKKNSLIVTCLFLMMLFSDSSALAQLCPGTVPNVAENFFTQPWQMMATGNDAKDFPSGTNMRVMVWDGFSTSASLGWNDGVNPPNSVNLADLKAIDPDVTLVTCNNTIYALVVFYRANTGYFLQRFVWITPSFVSQAVIPLYPVTLTNPTINIDGDLDGNFVIIWNGTNAQGIQVIAGTCTIAGPTLCTATSAMIPATTGCTQPDVSIYSRTGVLPVAHYTFLRSNNTVLDVRSDLVNSICNLTPVGTLAYQLSIPPGALWATPRIATPPGGYGANTHWSVAVVQDFPTADYILNITRLTGTIATNLTNGGIFCAFAMAVNARPAISYDSRYQGISVGWYTRGIQGYSLFGTNVVVYLGVNGIPLTGKYLVAPLAPNPLVSVSDAISISGRDHLQMMYTYVSNDPGRQVLYKDVPFLNISLKQAYEAEPVAELFPNPTTDQWNLKLWSDESFSVTVMDATGRLLMADEGKEDQLNFRLGEMSMQLHPGTYFIKVYSNESDFSATYRAVKM